MKSLVFLVAVLSACAAQNVGASKAENDWSRLEVTQITIIRVPFDYTFRSSPQLEHKLRNLATAARLEKHGSVEVNLGAPKDSSKQARIGWLQARSAVVKALAADIPLSRVWIVDVQQPGIITVRAVKVLVADRSPGN